MLSEITTAHELENEAKRVFKSGVNPNERHEALVTVVKEVARQRFPIQFLQKILNGENAPQEHLPLTEYMVKKFVEV